MYVLEYSYLRHYTLFPDARGFSFSTIPALQIVLNHDNRESDIVLAIIDSGATYSLFSFGIGAALGLDVFAGEEIRLRSLGSLEPWYAKALAQPMAAFLLINGSLLF